MVLMILASAFSPRPLADELSESIFYLEMVLAPGIPKYGIVKGLRRHKKVGGKRRNLSLGSS